MQHAFLDVDLACGKQINPLLRHFFKSFIGSVGYEVNNRDLSEPYEL